jgi:hypothetical protein
MCLIKDIIKHLSDFLYNHNLSELTKIKETFILLNGFCGRLNHERNWVMGMSY